MLNVDHKLSSSGLTSFAFNCEDLSGLIKLTTVQNVGGCSVQRSARDCIVAFVLPISISRGVPKNKATQYKHGILRFGLKSCIETKRFSKQS